MKLIHGKSHNLKTPNKLYNRYNAMKNSCYNPKSTSYKTNGARGIYVCDLWKKNFMAFYKWSITNGFTNKRVLHRINKNKGFSPKNCQWINYKTKNKLTAQYNPGNKAKINIGDSIVSITELSKILKMPYTKLYYHLTRHKVGKGFKKIDSTMLLNFEILNMLK